MVAFGCRVSYPDDQELIEEHIQYLAWSLRRLIGP